MRVGVFPEVRSVRRESKGSTTEAAVVVAGVAAGVVSSSDFDFVVDVVDVDVVDVDEVM